MKRFFYSLIFFIFFTSTVNAASFNWTKHDVTVDGSFELYYDKKTILKVGSYKYFWTLRNNLKDIQDDEYSTITHRMVNCETLEAKWISYTSYNSSMGRGDFITDFIVPEELPDIFKWNYYDPDNTIYGAMLDEICNIK